MYYCYCPEEDSVWNYAAGTCTQCLEN
jgi:hypothetical protein